MVEVRDINRHGIDIDERTGANQTDEKDRLKKDADDESEILNRTTFSRLNEMLLKQVATALNAGAREEFIVARIGGEEFAAVLPEHDLEQATAYAPRLGTSIAILERSEQACAHNRTVSIDLPL